MVIYDNTGTVLLDIEVDDTSVRYKAIKGENSLTLKFSLAEHVEVPLGAYCVFKNETYSLMLPEDFTLHHRRDFEYTLVMYSEDYSARRYKFVNPVDRRLKFSLTAKPIEHLQMFVDNMNMRDSGWEVGECPDHVEIVLSYNHTYCHDALVQLADELELDYWFNGKIVNLGKLELNKDNPLPLSYGGDGEGLKSDIKRTNYSDGLPIEVLYVQGSSTNIDPSKYRVNDKPVSELHLPLSQTIGFDGTYFEDEDGYDATKARQYKTDENGFSIRRADKEVANHSEDSLDCSEIEPTKTETVVSVIEVNTEKHFYDILFESTVDYSKYIIEGEKATVIFQSGMLAGKEFDLATDENGNLVCKQEDGKWRVEIVPQEIDGITMPDSESGYAPSANDTFKVFGIQLPDEYISDNDTKSGAEWDMFRFAVKHFYANEDVQYTISGELDEIYAKRNWESIKDRLTLGSYISFSDKSFQEEPLLIRITGIKDYVNKPYSPQLEISKAALSGTLVGTLNRIENQEVETEDKIRQAIGFSKRRWRDVKETLSMLNGAVSNFSESINPITVETMTMLVGDERLQFVFTDSLASDNHSDLIYNYDATTGVFSVQGAFIKHMTLGIDSISPVHAEEEYKRWSIAEVSEALEAESGYYLYAKVSKDSTSGVFELHKTAQADTSEWYYLLVGILNSEYEGDRSFASMYGYTEVRPGQITTDNIRSSDGKTWLDLLKGILHLNDKAGISGVLDAEKGDKSIAAWFGGLMKDLELDSDIDNAANTLFRHDGSGYLAKGNIKFNEKGEVELSPNIKISGTGNETLDSILTMLAVLNDMFYFADENTIGTKYNFFSEQQVGAGGIGEPETGEGTAGVIIDTEMSDTSSNPVANKTIKEYVDNETGELDERITAIEKGGASVKIEVDTEMSATSENAVQNKVIKAYIDDADVHLEGYVEEQVNGLEESVNRKISDVETTIEQLGGAVSGLDASKAGAFYVEESTGLFIAFTTEEAKTAYISDGDESGIIGKYALAGSGGSGETLYSMQVTNLQSSYSYTTASEKMEITANFTSKVKYAGNDSYETFSESAIFSVEVYKAGGTSSSVVANGVIVQNGGTFKIDLKPYVGNGDNTVIVKAVGLVSSASGIASTTVSVTSMSLSPFSFNWHLPFIEGQSYKLGGLRILGSLDKTLHIKVTGSGYSKEYTVAIGTTQYDKTAYNYTSLEHPSATGIYKVEMWLEATASGLLSETLTYNIMCVTSEDASSAQLICINNVASEVQNYAESTIFDYAIYNAGATSGSPTITLAVGSTTIASTTLPNVTTASQNTYKYSFSIANAGSSATITATATYGNTQTATMTLNNETSFAPVDGYSFYLNAATRSNAESNKRYIVNEVDGSQISASWTDMAWVDGMDGWTTDENGYKCLLLPAMSHAVVQTTPMKDKTTVTIEMLYKVKNASDYTEDIITIATDTTSSWMGVKIKPTNITLHSQSLFADDLVQGYNLKDEELVHLVIMIEQNYAGIGNIAMVYVNGVKKCAFEWYTGDTFAHGGVLKLGSDTADLYLYSMRVYDSGFEWESAMQNYISALQEITERVAVNVKEQSVLTDANDLTYDKIYGKYNTFVVELPKGAVLPDKVSNPSNDAIDGSNLYINIVQDTSCTIQGDFLDVPIEGQGTTAMTYYRWNLRSKTGTIRITAKKNVASSMHSHKRGATALYNDLNLAIVGANEANGRVAVYQYPVYGFQKIENEDAPGTYYYEFIGLYTIGPDKGDKSTFGYDNEAYEDTLIHMEGTDHSPKGVGMDYPWEQMTVGLNDDGDAFIGRKNAAGGLGEEAWEIGACGSYEDASAMKTYLDTEFAPAYRLDYECTPLIVGLESGTTIADVNADVAAFRATMRADGFSYGDCLVYDNDFNTYYFNAVSGQYEADGSKIYDGLSSYGFSTSTLAGYSSVSAKTDYIVSCRKARYRAEMGDYWHLNDNLFHACFLDLIGATDNEKKNSYPYKFGTLASGSRWRWRQDDLDTIFDVNNQGSADKKYSIMNTDLQGTTMIYKGNTSYHWRCIREYYPTEMKEMMQTIMNKMVSLCPAGYGSSKIQKLVGCIRYYFWDYAQDYFTGGAYNIDAEWTYEDTWALYKTNSNVNAVHPLRQLLGSHYEAEVAWVTLRMLFLASMNEFGAFVDYVDTSEGQISFRQGGDFTFELTPAIDMRPSVVIGANSDKKFAGGRILAGNSTSISVAADTSADTMVYVQGADWLQDIGDFSKVKIGSSSGIFSVTSKRLQSLKVGDATASDVTTNMTGLEFGACPSMVEVEARNVAGLAGEIDLTKLPRLRRAYFGGTALTAIGLPAGSKVQAFDLPSTIQRMTLRQLPLLTASGLTYDDLNNLDYLWVEGNAYLDGYDMLKSAYEGGSPLANIRVIGFSKTGDDSATAFLLALADGSYHGITASGDRDNTINPVIVGTLNYDTIDGDVYDALKAAYGANLTINYDKLIAYIKFADPEVLAVLLANGVGDGTGITMENAEAVTTIGAWFKENTTIVLFNEFQFFIGVVSLSNNAFNSCSALQEITLPDTVNTLAEGSANIGSFKYCTSLQKVIANGVTYLGRAAFQDCSSLSTLVLDWAEVTNIGIKAFYNCTSLSFDELNLEYLESLGQNAFYGVKIKKLNLGKVTTLPDGNGAMNYGDKAVLEELIIPEGVTVIPRQSFANYTNMKCVIPQSVIEIGVIAFENTSIEGDVYLPNLTTLGYRAFYNTKISSFDAPLLSTLPGPQDGRGVFENCSNLTSISIPLVASVTPDAFKNCAISGQLTLNATSISDGAFYGNEIEDLYLPAIISLTGTTNIAGSFAMNTKLRLVDMGATLETMQRSEFYGCASLATFICRATTPPTLTYAISNILAGTPIASGTGFIYVPDESVETYKTATNWSTYASRIKPLSEYNG